MTNVKGVTEIKYFQHRSEGSVIEIFLTLGKVMKQQILKKVRAASCFGIITDEMTDVSVTYQLITFVQYFDNDSGTVEAKFPSVQDVSEKHHSANVQVIYDLVEKELQSTVGKKMAAVHLTTIPCEPNTAYKALRKPNFLQYLSLY